MQPAAQPERIEDGEMVYRKIPVKPGWYSPDAGLLSPLAFRPNDNDVTGLSMVRAEPFNTPEEAAVGPSSQGYYVAALRVGVIRQNGMDVVSRPVEGVRGHVEIPQITVGTRNTDAELTCRERLSRLWHQMYGPFPPHAAS